uniref:Uncharacterized protein n=1 Tax=Haptolina brevifila TaxID=156173 RepID=A0A7S2HJI9_9EUKA
MTNMSMSDRPCLALPRVPHAEQKLTKICAKRSTTGWLDSSGSRRQSARLVRRLTTAQGGGACHGACVRHPSCPALRTSRLCWAVARLPPSELCGVRAGRPRGGRAEEC